MRGTLLSGAGIGVAAQAQDTAASPDAAAAAAVGKVPRKKLGRTGIEVPIMMMGCCQTLDGKYDRRLHRAYQHGVDFLDTAQMYAEGQSHKTIAPFIKQVGGRDKLLIASKAHLKPEEASPERFEKEIDSCLTELETDYLDGFYMHMAHDEMYLEPRFLKMAEELKKKGKIRFFGISSHDGSVLRMMNKAATLPGGIDAVMFRYSFRQYGDLELNKAIDACKKAGIGLVAIKTLAAIPDDAEEIAPFRSKNFTPIQAKLKAVWADERIDALASQMGNVEQVIENVTAAVSDTPLTAEELMALHRHGAQTAHLHCNGCRQHCESCIDGPLRVADCLRYLMYYECYGKPEEARRLYHALGEEERGFEGVDLAAATGACPQGIDIAARLGKAKRLMSV